MKRDKLGRYIKGECPKTCFKKGNKDWVKKK